MILTMNPSQPPEISVVCPQVFAWRQLAAVCGSKIASDTGRRC